MHRTSRPTGAAPRGLRIFVCLLLVAAFTPIVTATAVTPLPLPPTPTPTTYYVDVATGNDTNTGAMADPFKSISQAASITVSGDKIIVAPGTYTSSEATSSAESFPISITPGVTLKSSGGPDVTVVDAGHDDTVFVLAGGPPQAAPGANIELQETVVEGLTVTRGAAPGAGGFSIAGVDVILRDVVITECYSMAGGGIFVGGSTLTLEDCSLERNGWVVSGESTQVINSVGGGIYAIESMVDALRTSFLGNGAGHYGGAVATEESWFSAQDCEFDRNWAFSQFIGEPMEAQLEINGAPSFFEYSGGAIASMGGSKLNVTGCEFTENFSISGGAIVCDPANEVEVIQSSFTKNFALISSDILQLPEYVGGDQEVLSQIPKVDSSVVSADFEPTPGSLMIDQCVFEDALSMIGSIMSAEASVTVQNSLFDNNDVGAATVLSVPFLFAPQESMVTDGLPLPSTSLNVINSTFASNAATMSVVADPDVDAKVSNSIFWGNGGGELSWGFLSQPSIDSIIPMEVVEAVDVFNAEVTYSDLEFGWDWELNFAPIDTGNISQDPLFLAPDSRDYRLSPPSPCMDTATSTAAPTYDLPGTTRPQDGDNDGEAMWDMGAYEAIYSGTLRTGGETRYGTSVKAVQEYYDEADVIVLARGDLFADGLAASGLCGVFDAPLLLTLPGELPYQTKDEIVRLGATKAYIMGGTGAISDGVKAELEGMGLTVERIGGYDRYATAALIAEEIISEIGTPTATFIARGDLFADALTVSPVAYGIKSPILLVRTGDLPDATVDILADLDPTTVVIAGGSGAVSFGVEKGVEALTVPADRIDGADRYETSVAFSEYAIAQGWAKWMTTGLATGVNFPDALTGGPALGVDHGVLLLTPGDTLHASVETVLTDNKAFISRLDIFGGNGAISDSVMAAAEDAIK